MIAALPIALLALAAAPDEAHRGWVRPEPTELVRVLGMRWTAQMAEPAFLITHPEQWSSPYVTRDHTRILAATTAGLLEARAVTNGEVLWRKTGMGSVGAAMAEHHGRILLSSGSNLLALDARTGDERWHLDIGGGIGGAMVVTGTVAIIPVRSNMYLAVDAEKGELLWRVKRPTPEGITMRGQAPPAIDVRADRVFLGFSDGALVAASLSKGDVLWTASLGKPGMGFADVDAEPMIEDGGAAVVAASYSGGLFKLDAQSGRVIWKKEEVTHLTGLARAGSDGVFVGSQGDGQVVGIVPSSGAIRWRYKMKKGSPTDPLYLGRGFALVGCTHGPLAVLDVNTGKPVQLITPGSGVSVAPGWRDPDLSILTNKGMLLALRYGEGLGISL